VWLRIGKGEMPGERVQLKKPLTVLTKASIGDGARDEDGRLPSCAYHVVGVIREKLVFKTRPTPITSSLPQKASSKRQKV
jgi:chromosome transmission fidelity protein 8